MKKKIAKLIYKLLKPYITVESYVSPITLTPVFTISIFHKNIAEIKITEKQLLERVF